MRSEHSLPVELDGAAARVDALLADAWLFDDPNAYRAGVLDTLASFRRGVPTFADGLERIAGEDDA